MSGGLFERRVIILGVTGSIAAYKAAELASTLHQRGHDVHVVMTESAMKLVSPATFHPLTANPVHTDLWDEAAVRGAARVEHVGLADRADVFCIAPCTAHTIGRIAGGIASDFLTTLLLAYRGPVVLAPAMNDNMYTHPIVQRNLEQLRALGHLVVEPDSGALACGREGVGRLAEPIRIVEAIERAAGAAAQGARPGRRIVVSAGPTREWIDPVRCLTNPSTGRMGDELAAELARRGHEVTLVRGPADRSPPPGVRVLPVVTTDEMRAACEEAFADADALVMAAAPCDFRPAKRAGAKLKKAALGESPSIALERTPDILAGLGKKKRAGQRLVGFALETDDGEAHARQKLEEKRLDLIVLNGPQNLAVTTGVAATLLWPDGEREEVSGTKAELAHRIATALEQLLT